MKLRWNIASHLGRKVGLLLLAMVFLSLGAPASVPRIESSTRTPVIPATSSVILDVPEEGAIYQPEVQPQSRGFPPSRAEAAPNDRALIVLNPPSAYPGQGLTVEGYGFPPGQSFDLTTSFSNGTGQTIGRFQTDGDGRLQGVVVEVPQSLLSGSVTVVAQNASGPEKLSATGYVSPRVTTISLSSDVGKAGDAIAFSANGFAPSERVLAYLNSLGNNPFAVMQTDEWGNLAEAPAVMPFAPTGENTVILVGEQSKVPATASYIVIGFFPTVILSNYAPRGDEAVGFSGRDFGPNEQVRVHLNNTATAPIRTLSADGAGSVEEINGFDVPFGLKGKQTFIFVGESSGAVVPVDFEAMSYSPSVQPSTWAGRPGTSVTFYGNGFARNELVRVSRAATRFRLAEEASCFRTNENGEVGGLGSYIVQATDETGQLNLELVTEKSQVTIPLSIQVLPPIGDLPPGAIQSNRGCDDLGANR